MLETVCWTQTAGDGQKELEDCLQGQDTGEEESQIKAEHELQAALLLMPAKERLD